jgi:hypothetical protein
MLQKLHYENLQNYLTYVTPKIKDQLQVTRARIDAIDAILECESDLSEDTQIGESLKANNVKDRLVNTEIGITTANHETAWAFLCSTFLSGYPIFAATSSRDKESAAAQMTKLSQRDQIRFGWTAELAQALYDSLAYPFFGVEVNWTVKTASSVVTRSLDTLKGSTSTGVAESVLYQGNSINYLDPYNSFFDDSVVPAKVHELGIMAGKVEKINYIQLKRDFHSFNDMFTFKDNIGKVWESPYSNRLFALREPPKSAKSTYQQTESLGTNGVDWTIAFSNQAAALQNRDPFCSYEKVTIYARIIPKDYKIDRATLENPGAPRVFKLVFVNNLLILAEPITAGHEYLPMVFGRLRHRDMNRKSLAEFNAPIQDLNTALITATLDSLRKGINGGDILYNSNLVDSNLLLRTTPSKPRNIAVKLDKLNANQDLNSAYKQIGYQDQMAGQFPQLMGVIQSMGDKSIGINNATTGNFTKGNRTMHEFDSIMNNSQSRLALGALLMESQFFNPIKEILKINYLLFSEPESVTTPETDVPTEIDPVALRQQAPDYVLSDGLLPTTKVKNTDAAITALQILSSNQESTIQYNLGAIAASIIKQSGFSDLGDYERTSEEQQAMRDSINAAANPTPTGA